MYDKIMEEVSELEDELEQELKKMERKVGYVAGAILLCMWCMTNTLTALA